MGCVTSPAGGASVLHVSLRRIGGACDLKLSGGDGALFNGVKDEHLNVATKKNALIFDATIRHVDQTTGLKRTTTARRSFRPVDWNI